MGIVTTGPLLKDTTVQLWTSISIQILGEKVVLCPVARVPQNPVENVCGTGRDKQFPGTMRDKPEVD